MKLHFESNLNHQIQAINSITALFEGNPKLSASDNVMAEVVSNNLNLTSTEIFSNRDQVINQNGIENPSISDDLDFCIEMETGTGKTYAYLRTAFELHRKYGLSKFIIVVPSVPVKEGVIKTLNITKDHFKKLYNQEATLIEYDSKRLSAVKNSFCFSPNLSIMVMNMQAFNSDDNIINQARDINYGQPIIELIKQTRPIIVMDEPQEGMDSPNMIKRFESLNPLIKLRYSATHKVLKNLIYRLTPFEAYNQNLVKKIEVLSIHKNNTQSNVYIELVGLKLSSKKIPEAKLKLSHRLVGGDFKIKTTVCKKGDNLETKTKNPIYKGWVVEQIQKDPFEETEKVIFDNGQTVMSGQNIGTDIELIFREQIKRTIQSHYLKKAKLKAKNIKPLSLFFIDRVANYVDSNGLIRTIFEEELEKFLKAKKLPATNLSSFHDGYFAKTTKGDYTDSEASMKKNKEVYDLILKNKERLISFEEPVEFIFSHSALGVGWDNPNVFTICTLNQSVSTIKKRQEIGRGLRIAVNQDGDRVRDTKETPEDEEINLLTVVANESYYSFVSNYQEELREEYGYTTQVQIPRNANQEPTKVKLNKDKLESQIFRDLWQYLGKKSICNVHFNQAKLITDASQKLSQIGTSTSSLEISRNQIKSINLDQFEDKYIGNLSEKIHTSIAKVNIIKELADSTSVPLNVVGQILAGISNQDQLIQNPMDFLSKAILILKKELYEKLVMGVQYEIADDSYTLDKFKEIIETKSPVLSSQKHLYDHVIFDSNIEENFAIQLEDLSKVSFFLKLPDWYKIPTPIGNYNPDFALILETSDLYEEEKKTYYFAIETKGKKDIDKLTPDEKFKIECAYKHFQKLGLVAKDRNLFFEAPVTDLEHLNQKTQENPKIQKPLFSR